MKPRETRIELEQVSLAALEWGPADGLLAVCLHGFPDTAWTWRHLGPALADHGWRVVAPFTRGYAPSTVATDGCYHVGALMADAVGVHEALGGDERAVLVGHDWGAVTANALAAHPDSPFRAVVSMAVPPFPAMRAGNRLGLDPGLLLRQVPRSWYVGFNQLPWLPERQLDRLVPLLWRRWSPGYDATDDLPRVLDALKQRRNRSAALGYYRAFLRGRPPEPYRDWQSAMVDRPRVPTLYLHGADDQCLDVRAAARVSDVLPPGSHTVVVEEAGHFLHLEQPADVNHRVIDFIQFGTAASGPSGRPSRPE